MRPPRLRTLLLVSNLAVLALPLIGIRAMRLYESALIRQTESELVAQAAVLSAAFREELRRSVPGVATPPPVPFTPSDAALRLARRPGLDLATDTIGPPPPDPIPAAPAEPHALAVGQALAPVLRDAQAVTLAALRITDAQGVVVASTGADLGQSLAGWSEVAAVLAGAPIATSLRHREAAKEVAGGISRTTGLRVFVALPVQGAVGVAGAVVLSRTPPNLGQAISGKTRELIEAAALLLAIGAALALGLSRLVTGPIGGLLVQARRAAQGHPVAPLPHPGTREVAALSATLAEMAATLAERSRYITAFAASVSHEFKTPLTALQGAAELLDEPLPDAERSRLLEIVGDSTRRMDRLVRRLLDLARADMMRPDESVTPLGVVLPALLDRSGLRATVDDPGVTVALPATVLEALLAALLDNAASHAGAGARVEITARMQSGRSVITVQDDGPGISPANRSRVFDAFFTTSRAQGGTGLGLAIVRAIATGAGGSVSLEDSARGARFRVELRSDAVSASASPCHLPTRSRLRSILTGGIAS